MDAKIFFDVVGDNILPAGITTLIGIGLYFMHSHQKTMERLYKVNLEQQRLLQDTLRDDHRERIDGLNIQIEDLREDTQHLSKRVDYWRGQTKEAEEKLKSIYAELPDIRDNIKSLFQNISGEVSRLSPDFDIDEVHDLKKEIESLQESVKKIDEIDEEGKAWLQDITNFSNNRSTLAERAAEYALRAKAENPNLASKQT